MLALALGCGGASSEGLVPADEADTSASADAAQKVDANAGGARGEACATGAGCASGACVLEVCAGVGCEDCPAGWGCDVDRCVPDAFWLCAPCTTSTDCSGGTVCAAVGPAQERFCLLGGCAPEPDAAANCPSGTTCQELEGAVLCVPAGGLCGCAPHHDGRFTPCGADQGCAGNRTCSGGELGACVAESSAERCDGFDNDCNGETDEGAAALSCDDGVACTTDACALGTCVFGVAPGKCLIEDGCWDASTANPDDGCEECDPARSSTAWSPLDVVCSDGDPCTVGDHCEGGACVIGAKGFCDDGLTCTADLCTCDGCVEPTCSTTPAGGASCYIDGQCWGTGPSHPTNRCLVCDPESSPSAWSVAGGATCDDGDACTTNDTCSAAGACGGPAKFCDDDKPCTEMECVGGACMVIGVADSGCFIGGACRALGDEEPKNPCRICNGGKNPFEWTPKSDGQECGTNCLAGGTCAGGVCADGVKLCDCFDDSDCDDADQCNGHRICFKQGPITFWRCEDVPDSTVVCGDLDASDCRVDVCQPETGVCAQTAVTNGIPCTDGDPCTGGDRCEQGSCASDVVSCDDGNSCTADGCGAAGCTNTFNALPCTDGDSCTSDDVCADGVCRPGVNTCGCTTAADCPSGVSACVGHYECEGDGQSVCILAHAEPCDTTGDGPCRTTACDPSTGGCAITLGSAGAPCDDGDACTTGAKCDGGSACGGGSPVQCADGNSCTTEQCEPLSGCVYTTTHGVACDDGDECTIGDACEQTSCKAGPVTCQCDSDADCPPIGGNACTGKQVCDRSGEPLSWSCAPSPDKIICAGTGNPCTKSECDPTSGGCVERAIIDGIGCDDGDPCSFNDMCLASACTGTFADSCSDGLACTLDACDGLGGCDNIVTSGCVIDGMCIANGTASSANPCLRCEAAITALAWTAVVSLCNDGNPCTKNDVCGGGVCAGVILDCGDGHPCTEDSCVSGGCQNTVTSGWCLIGELCVAAGASEGQACLVCDPNTVSNTWSLRTGSCDDNDACTLGDTCQDGACTPGSARNCEDGDSCTVNSCDPETGCKSVQSSGCICSIQTGCAAPPNACFSAAQCLGGLCNYAPKVCPAPTGPCQQSTCNTTTGACGLAPANDGQACSLNDPCVVAAKCQQGACTASVLLQCDDGKVCTADLCQAGLGCVHHTNSFSVGCYDGPAGPEPILPCQSGFRTCGSDGNLGACVGQILPGADICNGVDDDCDGTTDKAFPGLGTTCDGADDDHCKNGVIKCISTTASACVESGAGLLERCNGFDDDCDGFVDDGCDDDGDGYCDGSMIYENPNPGGLAVCQKGKNDCDDAVASTYPGAEDIPDTAITDSNCDLLDGDLGKSIFVSALCGSTDATGTAQKPFKSIGEALTASMQGGYARTQVLIDTTPTVRYPGGFQLHSGVGLYGAYRAHTPTGVGGYTCGGTWTRAGGKVANPTTIESNVPVDGDAGAAGVLAIGLTAPTTLQWLRIEARYQSAEKGGRSTYGVYVAGGHLVLEECAVIAGDGLPGADQDGRGAGKPGVSGNDATSSAGAAPKTPQVCDDGNTVVPGGAGGSSINTGSGAGGEGGPTGQGGSGGAAGGRNAVCAGFLPGAVPVHDGQDGGNAASQTALNAGDNASDSDGDESIQGWIGAPGHPGAPGHHGASGGGGGGGGASYVSASSSVPGGGGVALHAQ